VAVKRNVLKSQLPLIIVAATAVLLALIYFVYQGTDRSKCDSIFEQTADRLSGNLKFINIEVKDATTARINPNSVLGSIVVDPLTRKEFPEIKEVVVFDAGTTGRRLIRQRTDKPGAMLPIPAGTYDVECKTADGSEFILVKNVQVNARESKQIATDNEIAGFVINDPKVSGLEMEAIYALRAGTNEIAAESKHFGEPILIYAGESYDIALKPHE
jgi:hypothetical protein